ncbi:hypothetical protein D3C80_59630 [compost metagenome]
MVEERKVDQTQRYRQEVAMHDVRILGYGLLKQEKGFSSEEIARMNDEVTK